MNAQYKFGPSGGNGGGDFCDTPLPGAKIKEIEIWADKIIRGIQITWADNSRSEMHGNSPFESQLVRLKPDEYLVGISGRYGKYLDSITFITTKKEHSFGGAGGDVEYAYNATPPYLQPAHIIGFLGQSDTKIHAIGCIFATDK